MTIVLSSDFPSTVNNEVAEFIRGTSAEPRIAWISPPLIEGRRKFASASASFQAIGARQALDAAPDAVWSVGDNLEWDVFAPQRLGMHGIWNDHADRGLPADAVERPARVVYRVYELTFG